MPNFHLKRLSRILLLGVFALALVFSNVLCVKALNSVTVTLMPGWNVFSTPGTLSKIEFSNGGQEIDFYKYEGGEWLDTTIAPTIENIKPLEGFVVHNSNDESVQMTLTFKITDPGNLLHQKTLSAGWNIIGVAHSDYGEYEGVTGNKIFDNFPADSYGSVVDFTVAKFTHADADNNLHQDSTTISSSEVDTAIFQRNKSYAMFIKKDDVVYAGTQIQVGHPAYTLDRTDNFSGNANDPELLPQNSGQAMFMKFSVGARDGDITIKSMKLARGQLKSVTNLSFDKIDKLTLYHQNEVLSVGDIANQEANFSFSGIDLASGWEKNFEIKITTSSNTTLDSYLKGALTIEAEADGEKIEQDTKAYSGVFKIVEETSGGLLTTTIDGDTPEAGILVADSTEVEIAQLKASAVDDNILIKKVYLSNVDNTGAKIIGDTITDGRIAKLKLYGQTKDAAEVMVDEGYLTDGNVVFNMAAGKEIYVQADKSITMRVTVDTNRMTSHNQTGKYARMKWQAIEAISEASGDDVKQIKVANEDNIGGADVVCWDLNGDGDFADIYESNVAVQTTDTDEIIIVTGAVDRLPAAGARVVAYSGSTCSEIYATNVIGLSTADLFTGRKTKPTFTNESLGYSTLTDGNGNIIFKTKVIADNNEDVALKRLTFEVSLDGVGAKNFEVYEKGEFTPEPATIEIDVDNDGDYEEIGVDREDGVDNDDYNAEIFSGTGKAYTGSVNVRVTFTTAQEIQAGGSKTFELRADVMNLYSGGYETDTAGDTVSTRLVSDAGEDVDAGVAGVQNTGAIADIDDDNENADKGNNMIWSDKSASGHDEHTADWTNGFNVKPPTEYISLSR